MSTNNPMIPSMFLSNEVLEIWGLDIREIGLLQVMRLYSLKNNGIPDTEYAFENVRRVAMVSKYLFRKLWPRIENFFTLREGFFYCDLDEERKQRNLEISHKRRLSGRLGAEKRWSQREVSTVPLHGKTVAPAIANAISEEWQTDGIPPPPPSPLTSEISPPPPPTPSAQPDLASGAALGGGGGGSGRSDQTQQIQHGPSGPLEETSPDRAVRAETGDAYRAILGRCAELKLPTPSKRATQKIANMFPPGWSAADIARHLPLYEGQKSPGLWLDRHFEDLVQETERQARKPAQGEHSASDRQALAAVTARRSMK